MPLQNEAESYLHGQENEQYHYGAYWIQELPGNHVYFICLCIEPVDNARSTMVLFP